MTVTD